MLAYFAPDVAKGAREPGAHVTTHFFFFFPGPLVPVCIGDPMGPLCTYEHPYGVLIPDPFGVRLPTPSGLVSGSFFFS